MDYETADKLAEKLHKCETVKDDVVLLHIGDETTYEWEKDSFGPEMGGSYEVEFYTTNQRALNPEVIQILADEGVGVCSAMGDWFQTRSD